MTSVPAARPGLPDRALLRPGLMADITVIDSDAIADRATEARPHHYLVGVQDVLVHDQATVSPGTHLGTRAGRVIRGAGAQVLRRRGDGVAPGAYW